MALGSAALVLGSGLSDGIARQLTASLVAVQTGHLQVVARPADFEPQNSPFDAYSQERLPGAEALARAHRGARGRPPASCARCPTSTAAGTAIAGNRSTPGQRRRHRCPRESRSCARRTPRGGRLPARGRPAGRLRRGAHGAQAAPRRRRQRVLRGADAAGRRELARRRRLRRLPQGRALARQHLLRAARRRAVAVRLAGRRHQRQDDARRRQRAARARGRGRRWPRIVGAARGPASRATALRVETFEEAGRFSFSIIQANQTALAVLSSFLFAAAAVGIVNSMLMSVHERTREIGTVRALGMRRAMVVRMFVLEGLALGVVSAAAGVALGGAGRPLLRRARHPHEHHDARLDRRRRPPLPGAARRQRARAAALAIAALSTAGRPLSRPGRQPAGAARGAAPCLACCWPSCCAAPAPPADEILPPRGQSGAGRDRGLHAAHDGARPGKPERVVEMKGWKKGDDLGLVRYTARPRSAAPPTCATAAPPGSTCPRPRRSCASAPSRTSAAATSGTATSSASRSPNDYVATLAGEETVDGQACWKLELKAKDRSVAYDRVVYWVRTDGTFFPVRADYYTISGRQLKWLTIVARWRSLGGRARPDARSRWRARSRPARAPCCASSPSRTRRSSTTACSRPSALERGE